MINSPFDIKKNVSRETIAKLEQYRDLLAKWQKAVNLVSPKTLDTAWERHFIDSAQISQFLPKNAKTLLDLGSGAGFPGLVLAIMHPDINVHLVESDEKKGQFLKNVSRETFSPVTVHNIRIENLDADIVPDVITARALADLSTLLKFALPYALQNPDLVLLLPKGGNAGQEIEEAQKTFAFDVTAHQSITNPEAKILEIRQLTKIDQQS